MKVEFTLPPGTYLRSMESSGPTKDGSYHWQAWLGRTGTLEFRGGAGFTPQEAIDKAYSVLQTAIEAHRVKPDARLSGLSLNLERLKL